MLEQEQDLSEGSADGPALPTVLGLTMKPGVCWVHTVTCSILSLPVSVVTGLQTTATYVLPITQAQNGYMEEDQLATCLLGTRLFQILLSHGCSLGCFSPLVAVSWRSQSATTEQSGRHQALRNSAIRCAGLLPWPTSCLILLMAV